MFSEITSITLQNFSVFIMYTVLSKIDIFQNCLFRQTTWRDMAILFTKLKTFLKKNHGSIRTSLHHQNGHAKSRDTVLQFAKSELTKHVITGGYMHLDNNWWAFTSTKINAFNTHSLAHLILNLNYFL